MLKSARQYFYHMCSSLWEYFSCKMSLLVICEILRPFFNLLTLDDKYSLGNKENLTQPIQTQLSKKRLIFFNFLLHFRNLTLILNNVKRKKTLIAYAFPKLQAGRDVERNCLRSPISEQPRIVNILKGPKHCWNPPDSSFLIFFKSSWKTLVRKSCYKSYPKAQYGFFAH